MVVLSFKLIEDFTKITLLIDQVARSQYSVEFSAHELLRAPGTISISDRVIFITEKLEVQRISLHELGQAFHRVWTDAEYDDIVPGKVAFP